MPNPEHICLPTSGAESFTDPHIRGDSPRVSPSTGARLPRVSLARRVPRTFYVSHKGSAAAGHPSSDFTTTLICADCGAVWLVRAISKRVIAGLDEHASRIAHTLNLAASPAERDTLWKKL